ncbi:hypothetical protein CFC21_051603 [Triticum aestivum]|uniref:Uncharacterized protein n=4 Tax=Triticum TaxID=4564 RepID=M8AB87_TRIUA|nr:hypothetical protein TRIUR3_12883 [Triticum urartu]KAF7041878.1 hypothetical protein CFC21_051603 [Triticum aestivum]VAH88230.1 unnamed protein product [Triticum turgidum subsp. durum]
MPAAVVALELAVAVRGGACSGDGSSTAALRGGRRGRAAGSGGFFNSSLRRCMRDVNAEETNARVGAFSRRSAGAQEWQLGEGRNVAKVMRLPHGRSATTDTTFTASASTATHATRTRWIEKGTEFPRLSSSSL